MSTEKTKDPIVLSVMNKFNNRSVVGLAKYGVGLDRKDLNLKQWLIHAQEEAMDMVNYLERCIKDIESKEDDLK